MASSTFISMGKLTKLNTKTYQVKHKLPSSETVTLLSNYLLKNCFKDFKFFLILLSNTPLRC